MIDTDFLIGIVVALAVGVALASAFFGWRRKTPQRKNSRAAKVIFQTAHDAIAHHENLLKETLKLTAEIVEENEHRRVEAEAALERTLRQTKALREALPEVLPSSEYNDRTDPPPADDFDATRKWLKRQSVRAFMGTLNEEEYLQQKRAKEQQP